ncbi:response regulator [Pedobacter mucosus]|uniref:response regulator n=1 Tax=Pedobacter mucosus TaxID=2895286 RepID=UPI001EE43D8A|nr:response regulator [Pedobacter mucosus]UKT66028.1 response regulator [Pedobacter mucosus]
MIKRKILVVDDDNTHLAIIRTFLVKHQFDVQVLISPLFITEFIKIYGPDLIIMDINLGDFDGRLVCDKIKADVETANIPIILLTSLSHSEIARIECLADAIMGNPFEGKFLLSNITDLIIN